MTNSELTDVEAFLNQLQAKLLLFNVVYLNRDKNYETLLRLGITDFQRSQCIKSLRAQDYVSGPSKDEFGGTPLWVFGKRLNGEEIYIKIQINEINKPVICISFHIAEHPLVYPYK